MSYVLDEDLQLERFTHVNRIDGRPGRVPDIELQFHQIGLPLGDQPCNHQQRVGGREIIVAVDVQVKRRHVFPFGHACRCRQGGKTGGLDLGLCEKRPRPRLVELIGDQQRVTDRHHGVGVHIFRQNGILPGREVTGQQQTLLETLQHQRARAR